MKQKILSTYSIESEEFVLIQCTEQNFAVKKPLMHFVVEHNFYDDYGELARSVLDFCDTYIDAMYHFKELVNDRKAVDLSEITFGINKEKKI